MASFVVMDAPQGSDQSVYIRDGFHFLAFLVPPLWLVWHRLWIEALIAFAAMALLGALGSVSGFGEAAPLLSLLVSIYIGLEASALRIAALRRRGWSEWGVVDAANRDEAELKHVHGFGTESVELAISPLPAPMPHSASPRTATGPALGLFSYPDGR
jgi:hypothetical protein